MERFDSTEAKRGYLEGDFAFFHLKDMQNVQFEYHYHDFSKIVVFISGNVTYLVEGKAYRLKPWDILFINGSEVHKAVIDPYVFYERIIIWVNHGFLEKHSDNCKLMTCFDINTEKNSNLLRPDHIFQNGLEYMLAKLEEACRNDGFGSAILKNAILLQLFVELTRERLKIGVLNGNSDIIIDSSIQKLLDYINTNISGDLSIETLAARFYTSRYHLMHKFKQQTGYSVHNYIQQKRLIKADSLIRSGVTAAQASEQCGFNDYSSFARAYGKMFGSTPRNRVR